MTIALPATDATALRKAAVLVASLPLEDATHLTQALGTERLERLANAIATLHVVDPKEQRGVVRDLNQSPHATRPAAMMHSAEASQRKRDCEQLDSADPSIVAMVLRDELPQIIAVLLSQISPASAAQVLRRMSTDRQLQVVRRMAAVRNQDENSVSALLRAVSDAVDVRSRPLRDCAGGEAFLAHVIHCTDRATEKALLENLSEEDRPLVDRLLQRIHVLKDSRRPCYDGAADETERRAG